MSNERLSDICFVILVGLPGSGKSWFASLLSQTLLQKGIDAAELSSYKVLSVCYDELVPYELYKPLKQDISDKTWRQSRKVVIQAVEGLICHILGVPEQEPITDRTSMLDPESELTCIGIVNKLYGNLKLNRELCNTTMTRVINKKSMVPTRLQLVIIIDDNMYYQSMRYEYFQLAKRYSLGFCQFYLECSLADALRYNVCREHSLPDEVIITMSGKIEPPNPKENKWEKLSCVLPAHETVGNDLHKTIFSVINIAMSNPVPPLENLLDSKAAARVLCMQSVVHQADLVLRKIVKCLIEEKKSTLSKEQLYCVSRSLNEKRRFVLESVKNGQVLLPDNITRGVEQQQEKAMYELQNFIECLYAL